MKLYEARTGEKIPELIREVEAVAPGQVGIRVVGNRGKGVFIATYLIPLDAIGAIARVSEDRAADRLPLEDHFTIEPGDRVAGVVIGTESAWFEGSVTSTNSDAEAARVLYALLTREDGAPLPAKIEVVEKEVAPTPAPAVLMNPKLVPTPAPIEQTKIEEDPSLDPLAFTRRKAAPAPKVGHTRYGVGFALGLGTLVAALVGGFLFPSFTKFYYGLDYAQLIYNPEIVAVNTSPTSSQLPWLIAAGAVLGAFFFSIGAISSREDDAYNGMSDLSIGGLTVLIGGAGGGVLLYLYDPSSLYGLIGACLVGAVAGVVFALICRVIGPLLEPFRF